ncbi:hypothetical protein EGT74_26140 [Chitinophaga lutea]|uniref:Uncharacterized protein n=1 Tax=Chitinophaga lutea TaxID=2488634 RepID=A0A3N4PCP7_9BACT|nr:hypothetical protein [Chitinophaga lutea]RPE05845.1 hypothetical protein EGT74_26140 [Chitinophaga lutea]
MKRMLSLAAMAVALLCFSSFAPLLRACSFNAVPNWELISGSIASNGATTTYSNLVVKNTNHSGPWSYTRIATISGGCLPTAGEYNFFSESGRSWVATVTPDGDVLLTLLSGPSPSLNTTISIPADSYPN